MAEETASAGDAGDVSVGDLVVNLKGNGDLLAASLNNDLDLLDKLYVAANKLDTVLGGLSTHLNTVAAASAKQSSRAAAAPAAVAAQYDTRGLDSIQDIDRKAYEAQRKEMNAANQQALQDLLEYEQARIQATTSGLQKELALLQLYHRFERDERIRQGRDTETIDRTVALQQAAIEKQMKDERINGGGGSGGGEDGGHMSHYMMRRLGYHAGLAVGATGVGNDVTGVMAAVEGLGPAIGGAAVAVVALASLISGAVDRVQKLRDAQIEYNAQLFASSQHWEAIASSIAPASDASRMVFGDMQQMQAELRKMTDAYNERKYQEGTVTGSIGHAVGNTFEKFGRYALYGDDQLLQDKLMTSYDKQDAVEQNHINFERLMAEQQRKMYVERVADAMDFNDKQRSANLERANIEAMLASPLKQQLALENELANQRLQLVEKQQQASLQLTASRENDLLTANQALEAAKISDVAEQIAAAKTNLEQITKFYQTLQGALQQDQLGERLNFNATMDAKRKGLTAQQGEDEIQKRNAWANAYIRASENGYQMEYDLLVAKHQQEHAERERAGAQSLALDAAAYNEEVALAKDHAQQMQQITEQLVEAGIAATTVGWQRRRQVAEAAWQEEQKIFIRNNPNDAKAIAERQRAHDLNRQTEVMDDRQRINDEAADMETRILVVTRQITASEGEWLQKARELTRETSLTAAEIEMMHMRFMDMKQAEADAPIVDRMKQLNIELELATHHITEMEAAYRRLKLANPEANDQLLRQQAQMEAHVKAIQFAHQELSKIHPVMQLIDYARQLREAMAAGGLSRADAQDLLNKKGFDLFGNMDAGTFNSSYARGQVDVRGINLNSQFSVSDILRDNGKYLQAIAGNIALIAQRPPLN